MQAITLAVAAEIHKVSERTIRRWIAAGELKSVKRNGTVYVHPKAVEDLALHKSQRARPRLWTT